MFIHLLTSGFPLKTCGNDGKVGFYLHPGLNAGLPTLDSFIFFIYFVTVAVIAVIWALWIQGYGTKRDS